MTEQQKTILQNQRAETYALLNDISKDFADERALSDSDYISDSFTEYADSAVSIYYRDQYNYYVDNSEQCENALLELYDDLLNIKVCLIIDYLLNINEYLELADIEEIAEQDLDRWDDYAEQVNEKIKEEK